MRRVNGSCVGIGIGVLSLMASIVATARSEVWQEVEDAGVDIFSGQSTIGAGPLTELRGSFESLRDGVDLYLIRVSDQTLFSAQVACTVGQTPDMYLFAINGTGLGWSHGCSNGSVRLTRNNGPRYVWLAVTTPFSSVCSVYNEMAPTMWWPLVGATDWTDLPPNGDARDSKLGYDAVWCSQYGALGQSYTITLTGCLFSNFPNRATTHSWGYVKSDQALSRP